MSEKVTVFVPNGEDRKETAILLVGTAEEFDIDTRAIKVRPTGFYISEELARAVYGDDVFDTEEPEPEPEVEESKTKRSTKKTSGNRAAKTNDSEEE